MFNIIHEYHDLFGLFHNHKRYLISDEIIAID